MIKKLEEHSVDELHKKIEELGPFGDIFSGVITQPLKPTDEEIIAKINEIIEHVNKLEEEDEQRRRHQKITKDNETSSRRKEV